MKKIILHLCADIGSDSKPYADAGYDVRLIGKDIGVENYCPPWRVHGIIANPPCTMFSLARTKAKEPRNLRKGMILVKECLRIIWECRYEPKYKKDGALKFWVIENPTGILRQFLGMPAMTYNPYEYGHQYTKSTDLWGFFNIPKKKRLPKTKGLPSITDIITNNKKAKKSICPSGFAKAFFEANK